MSEHIIFLLKSHNSLWVKPHVLTGATKPYTICSTLPIFSSSITSPSLNPLQLHLPPPLTFHILAMLSPLDFSIHSFPHLNHPSVRCACFCLFQPLQTVKYHLLTILINILGPDTPITLVNFFHGSSMIISGILHNLSYLLLIFLPFPLT